MNEFTVIPNQLNLVAQRIGGMISILSSSELSIMEIGSSLAFDSQSKRIVAAHLKSIAEKVGKHRESLYAMEASLDECARVYIDNESKIVNTVFPSVISFLHRSRGNNITENSKVFDEEGGYGGDQGDMAHNQSGYKFLFWRVDNNKELFKIVRSYPQYKDYTDEQIVKLLNQINKEGCGYVAVVNAIFVQFEDRAEDFEKTFGFPMYDSNGDYNYNRLLLDIYAATDNKYFLDSTQGPTALTHDTILQYVKAGKTDEFIAKYGVPLFVGDNKLNPEAQQAILDEFEEQSVVTLDKSGMNIYNIDNRLNAYMNQHCVECKTEEAWNLSTVEVQDHLEDGKTVAILIEHFDLYREDGSIAREDVGGHWMTIIDVTDDGRYIVSSWGEKFYLKPEELEDQTFFIVDINPGR